MNRVVDVPAAAIGTLPPTHRGGKNPGEACLFSDTRPCKPADDCSLTGHCFWRAHQNQRTAHTALFALKASNVFHGSNARCAVVCCAATCIRSAVTDSSMTHRGSSFFGGRRDKTSASPIRQLFCSVAAKKLRPTEPMCLAKLGYEETQSWCVTFTMSVSVVA